MSVGNTNGTAMIMRIKAPAATPTQSEATQPPAKTNNIGNVMVQAALEHRQRNAILAPSDMMYKETACPVSVSQHKNKCRFALLPLQPQKMAQHQL